MAMRKGLTLLVGRQREVSLPTTAFILSSLKGHNIRLNNGRSRLPLHIRSAGYNLKVVYVRSK